MTLRVIDNNIRQTCANVIVTYDATLINRIDYQRVYCEILHVVIN